MSEHLDIIISAATLVAILIGACVLLKNLGKKGDDDRFGPHPD